jgi:hypothetical protein
MVGFKECFHYVKKQELINTKMYKTVFRLRSDTLFYDRLPSFIFDTKIPIFPNGKHGCGHQCLNDHLVFLPRTFASNYFNMADDYLYCGISEKLYNYNMSINKHWTLALIIYFKFNGYKYKQLDIPYPLLDIAAILILIFLSKLY